MVLGGLSHAFVFLVLLDLSVLFLLPVLVIIVGSFGSGFSVTSAPFRLPATSAFSCFRGCMAKLQRANFLATFF